jgi:hypothetical protein
MYGFARLIQGKDTGAYYHELFLRGREDLLRKLVRVRCTKGTGYKMPAQRNSQPDFYLLKSVGAPPKSTGCSRQMLQNILDGTPAMDFVGKSTVISDDEGSAGCVKKKKKKQPAGEPNLRPLRLPGSLRNVFSFHEHQAPAAATSMTIEGKKHLPTSSRYGPSVECERERETEMAGPEAPISSSLFAGEKDDSEYEYKVFHENFSEALSSFLEDGNHHEVDAPSVKGIDMKMEDGGDTFDDPIFWL